MPVVCSLLHGYARWVTPFAEKKYASCWCLFVTIVTMVDPYCLYGAWSSMPLYANLFATVGVVIVCAWGDGDMTHLLDIPYYSYERPIRFPDVPYIDASRQLACWCGRLQDHSSSRIGGCPSAATAQLVAIAQHFIRNSWTFYSLSSKANKMFSGIAAHSFISHLSQDHQVGNVHLGGSWPTIVYPSISLSDLISKQSSYVRQVI